MNEDYNYENALLNLRLNKTGNIISLHKPLLLLLVISEILKGHENVFLYDEIEFNLSQLLMKYGLKNTSKLSPQYPFVYLGNESKLWNCSINKYDLKHPSSANRKEVIGSTGKLHDDFYNYLFINKKANRFIEKILNHYWPKAYHIDILNDLGIFDINNTDLQVRQTRSRKFVEDVMDAYERKCAICDQSIRISEMLIGIDACHIKPIQHFGDDLITNGIALCKIHHWALDRGAITINTDMQLLVSKKLNGNKVYDYFINFERNTIFVPRFAEAQINKENLEYHYKYIFIK